MRVHPTGYAILRYLNKVKTIESVAKLTINLKPIYSKNMITQCNVFRNIRILCDLGLVERFNDGYRTSITITKKGEHYLKGDIDV